LPITINQNNKQTGQTIKKSDITKK